MWAAFLNYRHYKKLILCRGSLKSNGQLSTIICKTKETILTSNFQGSTRCNSMMVYDGIYIALPYRDNREAMGMTKEGY